MKVLAQRGHFKVVEQYRVKTGIPYGLRMDWCEYQVRRGRKIIARHEQYQAAWADAIARDQKDMETLIEV